MVANKSFKPTPHRGVNSVLCATLHAVATPLWGGLTPALGVSGRNMGTSGYSLYADDLACDVRDSFRELLADLNPPEAKERIVAEFSADVDDIDSGPVFWLSLAETMHRYGCLDSETRETALKMISSDADRHRWSDSQWPRRKRFLDTLEQRLQSTQSHFRRPRKQKVSEFPSFSVSSPDGTARATAFQLQSGCTQVSVEMVSNGSVGGGGVAYGECALESITLAWLEPDHLSIVSLESSISGQDSLFYYGRTVRISYVTGDA